MKTTEVWRTAKDWQHYLGSTGRVLAVTSMEVAATDQVELLPYAYLLLELDSDSDQAPVKRLSVMGAAGTSFQVGDRVELVLRKLKREGEAAVITYGLKAEKISSLT